MKFRLAPSRRFSVNSVVDTRHLSPYYGRLDVYASFNDTGDFEFISHDDDSPKPAAILCYPINKIVGRQIKTTALYARVFRFRTSGANVLDVQKYDLSSLEKDVERLIHYYPKYEEDIVDLYAHSIDKARIPTSFGRFWYITKELSMQINKSTFYEQWATVLGKLEYDTVEDSSGTGVIVKKRQPVTMIISSTNITDMEIVPVQAHRREENSYIKFKIDHFNNRIAIVNARNRVRKF